jgi:hypothetical protein
VPSAEALGRLPPPGPSCYVLEVPSTVTAAACRAAALPAGTMWCRKFSGADAAELTAFAELTRVRGWILAAEILPADLTPLAATLRALGDQDLVFTLSLTPATAGHATGGYRQLTEGLARLADPAVRDGLTRRLKELGFRYVTLDLEGFRSGNLNN